jgi:hypothetical protein
VVAGNPAKVIRQRFDEDIIRMINKIEWWKKSAEQLRKYTQIFSKGLEQADFQNFWNLDQ